MQTSFWLFNQFLPGLHYLVFPFDQTGFAIGSWFDWLNLPDWASFKNIAQDII